MALVTIEPIKIRPRKTCWWIVTVVLWAVLVLTSYYTLPQKQPLAYRCESSLHPTSTRNDTTSTTAQSTKAQSTTAQSTTTQSTTAQSTTAARKPSSPTKRQLLLVTYGRSGSSFTSAIISHDPSVFYIFEPLHVFNDDLPMENDTETTRRKTFRIIDAFLQCDFHSLDPNLFADILLLSSNSTRKLYQCLNNKTLSGHTHVECFLSTWKSCLTSNVTFIKTIRFRAEWTEHFLTRYPNLKILYLMRDVRAVLYSQARHFRGIKMEEHAAEMAGNFCQQASKDFQVFQRLNKKFPGRVTGIRYEHGCLDPVDYARTIYKFAGLTFNNTTKQYVQQITKSKSAQGAQVDPYSVVRHDSIQAMNQWRQTAGFKTVTKIDKICESVYSLFGYRAVRSQRELRSNQLLVKPVYNSIFGTTK